MTCKYFTSIVHHLMIDVYERITIIYSLYWRTRNNNNNNKKKKYEGGLCNLINNIVFLIHIHFLCTRVFCIIFLFKRETKFFRFVLFISVRWESVKYIERLYPINLYHCNNCICVSIVNCICFPDPCCGWSLD